MKVTVLTALVFVGALVVACGDEGYSDQIRAARSVGSPSGSSEAHRVRVTRLSIFHDELAYGNDRGVYLIEDTATGTEFIGVSGVGIAEVGSHSCGKSCRSGDER